MAPSGKQIAGATLIIGGIVSACIGLPVMVAGAKKRPVVASTKYTIDPMPKFNVGVGPSYARRDDRPPGRT